MTATRTRRYNRWDLDTLRAGKAYRDSIGETIEILDTMLAEAEAQFADGSYDRSEPVADAPAPARTGGSGHSTYGAANAPTEAQLRFLGSLCRDLGWTLGQEVPEPRDKRHASQLIDQAKKAVDALRRSGGTPAAAPVRLASERQRELIANLLTEKVWDADVDVDALSIKEASTLIDALFAAPRAKVAAHGIREGRYAYTTDGGATADHYRVTRTGRILIWSAGGEYPYTGKGLNEGLTWIKANPREAAELFGRLTETCGRCGRELSDDESRARGLGPVCAGKSEW